MKKLLIALTSILFCIQVTKSQEIKGKITDSKNQPIPFATVFISKLLTGTTANLQGEYHLKVPEGTYQVTYRSLGYREVTQIINVNGTISTDIILPDEAYSINEVTITKRGEDLAYGIMRKVIAWSSFHLHEVNHYESEVYLKGTVNVEKFPKILASQMTFTENGKKIKLKAGDVFLDESVNQFIFDAPFKYKHKVLSVHSTFPSLGNQPVSPIDFLKTSLYWKEILGLTSPLSPTAFSNYKFHYEGFQKDGNNIIDKIQVTPIRKSQELFEGYIYIVEDYWSLYSFDLTNEQFWGKIQIKQQFALIKDEAWLPVSCNFLMKASYLGVKLSYSYTASVKLKDLVINEKLKGPIALKDERQKIINKEEILLAQKAISKKDLHKIVRENNKKEKALRKSFRDTVKSMEIKTLPRYTMDSLATKKRQAYWDSIRPVPLMSKEIISFAKKDSIEKIVNPKTKSDSMAAKKTNPKILSSLLNGNSLKSKSKKVILKYDGLINPQFLSFNTVDGFIYEQKASLVIHPDSFHKIDIFGTGSYGFSRKVFMGSLGVSYSYSPMQNGRLSLYYKNSSADFNPETGIGKFYNSITSLLLQKNYMKLYDEKLYSIKNEIDISNGLQLSVGLSLKETRTLANHSDFTLIPINGISYTSNIPSNNSYLEPYVSANNSFTITTGLTYTPRYFYKIKEHKKSYVYSRYPTFTMLYKASLPQVLKSTASYQYISVGMHQNKWFNSNYRDQIYYELKAGAFLKTNRIHFSDFQHFNTQEGPLTIGDFSNAFQLLKYYQNSTSSEFVEGHLTYTTSLLLLKRLPIISNRIWNEKLYFNFLKEDNNKIYTELGYGLGQIFLMGEVSSFVSFENTKFRNIGFKVSIHF